MTMQAMQFEPWMLDALGQGAKTESQEALTAQNQDYLIEEKAKYDAQVAREKERKESMMWGGGMGGLLGLAALAVFAPAGLMAMPAWAWGTAAGIGGGLGALKEGWSGASAEGLPAGLFEQQNAKVAEEQYFDRLRSGILGTGLTAGLLGYGAKGLATGVDKVLNPADVVTPPSAVKPSLTSKITTPAKKYVSSYTSPSIANNPFIRNQVSNKLAEYSNLPPNMINSILGNKLDPLDIWKATQGSFGQTRTTLGKS